MTTCARCNGKLKGEIVAMQGILFCSEQCAVDYLVDEIILNAKESAKETYNEYAEIVKAEDIL